tara:strand:- start:1563 stop:1937 length:375 start_codon:yes stop_codon:yes gene_type:complete
MFCAECGKEIADSSKFCPECGKAVEPIDYDSIDKAKKSTWERAKELSEKAKVSNSSSYEDKTNTDKQPIYIVQKDESTGSFLGNFVSRVAAVVLGIFLVFVTCTGLTVLCVSESIKGIGESLGG